LTQGALGPDIHPRLQRLLAVERGNALGGQVEGSALVGGQTIVG
jgi:hypothetical protein